MNYEVVNNTGSALETANPTVIKVIGCGGGGSNAVRNMIEANVKNIDFIALNTDLQALNKSIAQNRLAIGQKITQGLGAGGDPSIGEKAAEEDKEAISNALRGANMVFVTAGMGGGTGTGSAPVVARIAKEMGALTVAIVTTPFLWEGPQRAKLAEDGLAKLREASDSVIVIPNSKIIDVFGKDLSFIEQLRRADDLLRQSITGVSTIVTEPGTMNIDFADVRRVMKDQKTALFGIGTASGSNRAVEAASKAINNPLLEDLNINGAKHFLINVVASDLRGDELEEISKLISASGAPNHDLKPGIVINEAMGDEISVTVIATGFGEADAVEEVEEPKIEEPKEEVVKQPSNVLNSDEFAKILSGKKIAQPTESPALFSQDEIDENAKPENYGSFDRSERTATIQATMDMKDINTPAVLRQKKNLSRTINFDRN